MQSSFYKSYLKEEKVFNGNLNKRTANYYYDNNNDIDKSRDNYTYYESKYSRKTNTDKNYNSNNNKISENNIVLNDENVNLSNIPLNINIIKNNRKQNNKAIYPNI